MKNTNNNLPLNDNVTRLNIDFIGKRKIYYTISLTLILIGILVSAILGVKLDIQFKGGAIIKYSYSGTIDTVAALQVAQKTIPNTEIQLKIDKTGATNSNMLVFELDKNISDTTQQAFFTALTDNFKNSNIQKYESNDVSPAMGQEFLRNSIGAVLLASLLIVLYIWIRFRHIGGLPAGLTAFVSLLHDMIMVFVAFSIFRIPLNDNFIAVVLTVIGYSINDTIVVYDRIRENRKLYGSKQHFSVIVNKSINQTFARSINTTVVVFVAISIICVFSIVFHIDSIRSFALPMMVGILTGCYSTICIAGPLWTTYVEYKERKNAPKGKSNKLSPKKA